MTTKNLIILTGDFQPEAHHLPGCTMQIVTPEAAAQLMNSCTLQLSGWADRALVTRVAQQLQVTQELGSVPGDGVPEFTHVGQQVLAIAEVGAEKVYALYTYGGEHDLGEISMEVIGRG